MATVNISRRGLLVGGSVAMGVAAFPSPVSAEKASERFPSYTWSGDVSRNGWPIRGGLNRRLVEGSAEISVRTAGGAAETILTYVARRYHYEIDWNLRPGDVVGYRPSRRIRADFESNYLSGSAITIREELRPLGAFDGLFPFEVKRVEAILGDLEGTVDWGGRMEPAKQSHFEIAVGPDDPALLQIAERIREDRTFINP